MDVGKSDPVCKTLWPPHFACYVADKSLNVHRVNEERLARTIGIGYAHRLVDVGTNNLFNFGWVHGHTRAYCSPSDAQLICGVLVHLTGTLSRRIPYGRERC